MDTNPNNNSDRPLTLKEIREQKRLIKAQLELHQLQRARRVLEASTNADYWLSSYVDLLDRYRDGDRLGYPISQPTDRRYGQNWPFWNTETQLSLFRAQARYLCSTNSYAIGLLGGLQAYVIGDGFQYRVVSKEKHGGKPSSLIPQVQAIVDEFCEVNQWWDWEQELFWRSREDGEYFLRYYPDNELQCLTVRSVEPEQVCTTGIPEGAAGAWSFGILTDPEDVQEIYAYNVLYLASPEEHGTDIREEVPVEDLQHLKINVRRTIKRGLTDFCYSTYDALHLAEKLRNNLAEGAAVQAALAYIRQHESATQAQVQNFLNTQQLDFSRTNPLTGLSINYKHLEPGSVVDIPRGMQYVQPPGAGNASGFIEILHASLRGAGCRWNAPEWLATASGADMAAYTASLTAHAPFVRTATQKQKSYKQAYTRVIKEAIQVAIDYGRLPPETFDIIDIQCEAPSIPAKSELDEAQANKIRVEGGWKSRQTVQQEEGLDPQRELQNIEEYNRRMGTGEKSGPVPVHEANFNPNEPRDERGRWTKAGGTAASDALKDLLIRDQFKQFPSSPRHATAYAAAFSDDDQLAPPTTFPRRVTPQALADGDDGPIRPVTPGSRAEAPPAEKSASKERREALRQKLIKIFLEQGGSLVAPKDMPTFALGIIKGFFKDGLGGTVGGIWDLIKFVARYNCGTLLVRWLSGDQFDDEKQMALRAIEATQQLGQQAVNLQNSVQKELMEIVQAIVEGDQDKLSQKLDQLSEEARVALEVATEVMTELAIAAIDLDAETKGRIYGWVLYQVAETAATVGAAKAVEAGALARLLTKLPEALQDSKIAAALEKAAAKVEKAFGEYKQVGGHHVHAKAAFKGSLEYDPRKGFSISQEFMRSTKWDHDLMTKKQRELFSELAKSGRPNTLAEHARIAEESLVEGGATRAEAKELVKQSIENLRKQGVKTPSKIPWQKQ
jgi:hypothetical protein